MMKFSIRFFLVVSIVISSCFLFILVFSPFSTNTHLNEEHKKDIKQSNINPINPHIYMSKTKLNENVLHHENKTRKLAMKKNVQKKSKNKPKPKVKYIEENPSWGFDNTLKYIDILPTPGKDPLRVDRKVVFPDTKLTRPQRQPSKASGIPGMPRELYHTIEYLKAHPLMAEGGRYTHRTPLEETLYYLHSQPSCKNTPIFISMATVGDKLYWQLIENFVYTMAKYQLAHCSIVICVSDLQCMKLCQEAYFPCYYYQEAVKPLPSVMEQIARVKLLLIPRALSQGVDTFVLDLDVGFITNPLPMLEAFRNTPIVDIMVQEDYIFIMDRYIWLNFHYKSWFTEPLPNIGMFLCRGNNKTAGIFEIAWQEYLNMPKPENRNLPGKDQATVLGAMRYSRGNLGLKYAYFTNHTAPLLDKVTLRHGITMELGGEVIENYFLDEQSMAIHTTCYEKTTKVLGLKASNSYWNPKYYDPLKRTLTKQMLFIDEKRLLEEIRSLIWLAISTGRSLIMPNIIGPDTLTTMPSYKGQVLWPGYRTIYFRRTSGQNDLKVDILEPGFYWRIQRDYDDVPEAKVVFFDGQSDSLRTVLTSLNKLTDEPRLVLHTSKELDDLQHLSSNMDNLAIENHLISEIQHWADDSISFYPGGYDKVRKSYQPLPSIKQIRNAPLAEETLQGLRLCKRVFDPPRGNRTCFQICK